MGTMFLSLFIILFTIVINRYLIIENLALRQQLAVMKQTINRPKIRNCDRIFWVILSKLWLDWKNTLIIVQPETVIRWHRKGFRLFWTIKSRKRGPGRPAIDTQTRQLAMKMVKENPFWGAPRIHSELIKLGVIVSERTVSNIIKKIRPTKPPSQTWRTFIKNHMRNTFAIDFFTVPTATFKVLYVFIVLHHTCEKHGN